MHTITANCNRAGVLLLNWPPVSMTATSVSRLYSLWLAPWNFRGPTPPPCIQNKLRSLFLTNPEQSTKIQVVEFTQPDFHGHVFKKTLHFSAVVLTEGQVQGYKYSYPMWYMQQYWDYMKLCMPYWIMFLKCSVINNLMQDCKLLSQHVL